MNRQKASGGQAIVMVTLALISMSGMMGLAVDLGWSYFSQKAAQGAADEAALSAVQRAYMSIINSGSTASAFTTCGTMGVTCSTSWTSCVPTATGLGNLQSGCIYARNAGFTPGGHNGKQNVLIEANVPQTYPDSIPISPGSPKDMVYWVSVKTYESIPSLFSSMLGNSNGVISAVATAAIASKIVPGSFYGMNQPFDCFTANGTPYCGVDLVGGEGSEECPSGPSAFLCAPAGAFIASTCNGTPSAGCSGNGAYAGSGSMNGGPGGINIPVSNTLDPAGTWTPSPTVTSSVSYQDPTRGQSQPPLAAADAVKSCGITGGNIVDNAVLGPFQYFHYSFPLKGGLPQPDGAIIRLPDNVTFAANGTCPGVQSTTGADQSNSAFPMYVFYGGLSSVGGSIAFGPGQYVMAGVTGPGTVFNADDVKMMTTGADSGSGNLFIFTNQNYPGLSTQLSTVPNNSDGIPAMQFGSVHLDGGSASSDLFGLANNSSTGTTNLPPALNAFGGILFWQDRANSTVTYDGKGNVTSHTNPNCLAATCVSPQLLIDHLKNNLHGVVYQPRGAWTLVKYGNPGSAGSKLQVQLMTGAVVGSDTGYLQLTSPTNQMIRYLPVLIQ